MDKTQYTQQIINDLAALPEDKIVEVADFISFLIAHKKQQGIPLEKSGLSRPEAINLRARLSTFEDDWNAPGMEVYDEL
jgi:hypothetical protein